MKKILEISSSLHARRPWLPLVMVAAATAAVVMFVPQAHDATLAAAQQVHAYLQRVPGFLESLSLIFMVELGDKTFFIAALLAMRFGKLISFVSSVFSLTLMTAISVGVGCLLGQVPQFVNSSLPIGQYAGAALLMFFGTQLLFPQQKSLYLIDKPVTVIM
jgi:hypothetical protein